jgi:enoyl-[acyl-carrier protein] reductase I
MPALAGLLNGKVGLVVGIANKHSIAAGCAQAFNAAGASLAVTYLNDKAKLFVEPVARSVNAEICMPLNVQTSGQLEAVVEEMARRYGQLDFLVHSIANCPGDDLHGRVVDCSAKGFALAMDVSVHSFIRMAHLVEPLMKDGGCLLTMSYYGAEKVVDRYNIMGPVKAALESTVRYMAAELGPKEIRVNAISPGPLKTRAASGIAHFDDLIEDARTQSPEHQLVSIDDVGGMAAFLVSDHARHVTGNITFLDAGAHVMA